MKLRYTTVSEWPRLAWLAVCTASSPTVECYVGSGVEVTEDFFCEGTWCGEYAEGSFADTDLFFGSGARNQGDGVLFVSLCATVDKLLALRGPGFAMVSNSLPCLLSCAGGRFELGCLRYEQIFASVCKGLRHCERSLPTTVGDLQLSYFEDLRWDGSALLPSEKRHVSRDFGSYARYRAFLDEAMAALADNARSSARRDPLRLLSTLSAGYDSAMVTVLGQQVGCNEAVGFDRARSGEDDSGEPIANALGIRFHAVDSSAWRAEPSVVSSFLAGGAGNGADVIFHGAKSLLRGTVLLTGFHGDKMWDRLTTHLEPDIVRGDASGSDLSEYRLEAGFVNCPVPFWGVRQIKDVVGLSNARSSTLGTLVVPTAGPSVVGSSRRLESQGRCSVSASGLPVLTCCPT